MKILKAFRFEIMPNGAQQAALRRTIGCCRKVYNLGLDLQIKRNEVGEKFLSGFDLVKQLPGWKKEFLWLQSAPAHALLLPAMNFRRKLVSANGGVNWWRG